MKIQETIAAIFIVFSFLANANTIHGQRTTALTSIGKLIPEHSGIPGHLIHELKDNRIKILGSDLEITIVNGTCHVIDQGKTIKKLKVGRHRLGVARKLSAKTIKYFVDVRFDGKRATIQSASGWLFKNGKQKAAILDTNLNGKLDQSGRDAVLHADSRTVAPFHGQLWFFHKGLKVQNTPSGVRARPIKLEQTKKITDGLATLNYYRQIAGLRAVALDADACQGCALHAKYDLLNFGLGHNRHSEDPKNPHYTEAGNRAANSGSYFGHTDKPGDAVAGNLDIPFHRRGLLDPSQKLIGMGSHSGSEFIPGYNSITVLAMTVESGTDFGVVYPIVYPAQGQTDVPLSFSDDEMPRPLPATVGTAAAGYPVTMNFPRDSEVGNAHLKLFLLRKKKRTAVKGYCYGPGHTLEGSKAGVYDYAYKMNSYLVHFIAAKSLKSNQRYLARATWEAGSTQHVREWEFTTGRRHFSFDGHSKF